MTRYAMVADVCPLYVSWSYIENEDRSAVSYYGTLLGSWHN